MTTIELIGDVNGRLDTYDDVDIPLTLSIASIKEPGKRSGLYSKTILLPGTTNNNGLLSYYFDVNLDTTVSSFNVYRKQDCRIIQDGISIYDNLLLKLLRVNKRNNVQTGEQFVEYEVEVKDYSSDFFNQIAGKKLEDINLSEFNHPMEVDSIVNSWDNTWTDGYLYPITKQDMDNVKENSFIGFPYVLEINQLRPMIFTKMIWDKIHKLSGYNWKWDANDKVNVNFQKTLISDNKSDKTYLDEINNLNKIIVNGNNYTYKNYFLNWSVNVGNESFLPLTFENEVQDYFNLVNTIDSAPWIYEKSTGNPYKAGGISIIAPPSLQTYYESQFNFQTTPSLKVQFSGEVNVTFKNTNVDIATFINGDSSSPVRMGFNLIVVNATTNQTIVSGGNIGSFTISDLSPLNSGESKSITIPFSRTESLINVAQGDNLVFYLKVNLVSINGSSGIWYNSSTIPINSSIEVTTAYRANAKISVDGIPTGSLIPVSTILPRKVTQRDFIDSVNKMFNLYVEPNPDNPRQMVYTQRDAYYDNGAVKDWTHKIARDREQIIEFLPDITSKSINFTYKTDEDDILNKSYVQATKEVWGKQTVDFSSEWVRGTQDVELIFGPSPIEPSTNIVTNRAFPYIDYDIIKNPKIMINSGNTDIFDGILSLLLTDSTTTTVVTECPYISHQYADISLGLDPELNPSFDLNFGINDYYFIEGETPSNLNLYTFWRRTMKQVDNGRQLTAYFDLTPLDMTNIKMNDKIKIDNTYWIINSIIDYNANKKDLTKVELLSVEDEMRIN